MVKISEMKLDYGKKWNSSGVNVFVGAQGRGMFEKYKTWTRTF